MIAASAPHAATASLSRVISNKVLGFTVLSGESVMVSHRPMIDAEGVAMLRAPVSTRVTVTP
ncbi:hypothetical protein D3C84_829220 [compost metagenome]